jgi:hypothetical protein
MFRTITLAALAAVVSAELPAVSSASEISGQYLETRTCQVYTGPCFANAEVGLTGKDAIMAWGIEQGQHQGVDLAGLHVVMVLNSSDTLGFNGIDDAKQLKAVIVVDERAVGAQREALIDFAKQHAGRAGNAVVRVESAPIQMSLDEAELVGRLEAGKTAKIITRKARRTDCICSNEVAYYPPLAKVENFAAGVTVEGEFNGRGLGTRWSTPESRSAYMATFAY